MRKEFDYNLIINSFNTTDLFIGEDYYFADSIESLRTKFQNTDFKPSELESYNKNADGGCVFQSNQGGAWRYIYPAFDRQRERELWATYDADKVISCVNLDKALNGNDYLCFDRLDTLKEVLEGTEEGMRSYIGTLVHIDFADCSFYPFSIALGSCDETTCAFLYPVPPFLSREAEEEEQEGLVPFEKEDFFFLQGKVIVKKDGSEARTVTSYKVDDHGVLILAGIGARTLLEDWLLKTEDGLVPCGKGSAE